MSQRGSPKENENIINFPNTKKTLSPKKMDENDMRNAAIAQTKDVFSLDTELTICLAKQDPKLVVDVLLGVSDIMKSMALMVKARHYRLRQ